MPASTEVLSVFGVVVFAVHSWSVGGFLYRLPYFMLKKPFDDLAGIFSYFMVFALLESILLTAALLSLAAALPAKWLREGFAYKGTLITATASGISMLLQKSPAYETFTFELANDPTLFAKLAAVPGLFLAVYLLGIRMPLIRQGTLFLIEQISIMLFIYIPLDVLGLVVIALRLV